MLVPSPFRASHRRSRSHSSLSSPSASPVLQKSSRDSSRAPCRQLSSRQSSGPALPVASVLTSQPPEKWDVEAWRRGKRARCDPAALAEDTDMDFADEPLSSSPILQSTFLPSAPTTARLPSSSDAFHFFPTRPMQTAVASIPSAIPHTATRRPTALGQMHADAFGDLHSSVSEAGEGFVRRMREFEASRSVRGLRMPPSSPSSSVLSHPGGPVDCESPPTRTRGRKRPSPTSVRCPSSAGVLPQSHLRQYGPNYGDEDESDVEIRSSCASVFDKMPSWSPSKKRAVSLSALSVKDNTNTSAVSLPYPIPLRSRDRSSSPLGSAYSSSSSDDDEDDGFSRRARRNRRNSRIRHRRPPRFVASTSITSHAIHPSLPKRSMSPPPLSFSFSNPNSNNSSRMSLPIGSSPVSPRSRLDSYLSDGLDCETPGRTIPLSTAGSSRPSKKAERAVAALSLALASGAGSVSDYEALREAKDLLSLDYSEAGSMWD